jgi:protein TonB
MSEGAARSFEWSREFVEAGRRHGPPVAARGLQQSPIAGSAEPMKTAVVIQSLADVVGLRPKALVAASLLYAGLVAIAIFVELPVKPPEPWPDSPTIIRVVFEPAPALEPGPAPAQDIQTTPAVTATEPAPVETEAVEAPAAPPDISAPTAAAPKPAEVSQPSVTFAPAVPPRKPALAHAPNQHPLSRSPAPTAAPPVTASEELAMRPPGAKPAATPPHPITASGTNAKPDYPAEAQRRGWQGRVVLRVEVSPAGSPLSVDVRVSSGHELLDQAALRAVRRWRFVPATQGDTPVTGTVDVPVQFRLED